MIEHIVPEYQEASVPLSIISVLSTGPIEEILFFGLPFYIFGNHLVVLGRGSSMGYVAYLEYRHA